MQLHRIRGRIKVECYLGQAKNIQIIYYKLVKAN